MNKFTKEELIQIKTSLEAIMERDKQIQELMIKSNNHTIEAFNHIAKLLEKKEMKQPNSFQLISNQLANVIKLRHKRLCLRAESPS